MLDRLLAAQWCSRGMPIIAFAVSIAAFAAISETRADESLKFSGTLEQSRVCILRCVRVLPWATEAGARCCSRTAAGANKGVGLMLGADACPSSEHYWTKV